MKVCDNHIVLTGLRSVIRGGSLEIRFNDFSARIPLASTKTIGDLISKSEQSSSDELIAYIQVGILMITVLLL